MVKFYGNLTRRPNIIIFFGLKAKVEEKNNIFKNYLRDYSLLDLSLCERL